MADQGQWFKLWCSADDDPDLGNLSNEDFGRWCKFGTYCKKHGTNGVITIPAPAIPLQRRFGVTTFDAVVKILNSFPHISVVSSVTDAIVTWSNWNKYQGDSSAERTREWRQRVTPKKRREEKREEENIEKDKSFSIPPERDYIAWNSKFIEFWALWPKERRLEKRKAQEAWGKVCPPKNDVQSLLSEILLAVERYGKSNEIRYLLYPHRWIERRRWEDEAINSNGKLNFVPPGNGQSNGVRGNRPSDDKSKFQADIEHIKTTGRGVVVS